MQTDQDLCCLLTESVDTVVYVDRECPDQTAWVYTLIWTFAVRIWHKGLFLTFFIISDFMSVPRKWVESSSWEKFFLDNFNLFIKAITKDKKIYVNHKIYVTNTYIYALHLNTG